MLDAEAVLPIDIPSQHRASLAVITLARVEEGLHQITLPEAVDQVHGFRLRVDAHALLGGRGVVVEERAVAWEGSGSVDGLVWEGEGVRERGNVFLVVATHQFSPEYSFSFGLSRA